ncbi:MAG: DUF504 domain-containing protein [Euryarchaeota archaeon]|nr:DUF504 domain-containing protein [Euryarchaeota archaeon]
MAKRVLDELKWHPEKSLREAEVTYVHRGAPGDEVTISGGEILALEKSFFVVVREGREVRVPYHRIKEIKLGGEVVYRKRAP